MNKNKTAKKCLFKSGKKIMSMLKHFREGDFVQMYRRRKISPPATLWLCLQGGQNLKQETSSNLNDSHTGRARDDAKGTCTAECTSWPAQVDEVEDVRCLTTELKLHTSIDVEVSEDRCIDIFVSWRVERIDPHGAIQLARTSTRWATGARYPAIRASVEPLGLLRRT
jgi:hypothetical protein